MPNQSTELQKGEKEKSIPEQLSENPSFNFWTKTIGGLAGIVGIISGISTFFLFIFFKLPEFIFGVLGLLSAFISSISVIACFTYYFISIRPVLKRVEKENRSLKGKKTELSILPSESELERTVNSLKREYENKIKILESKHNENVKKLEERHNADIQQREASISEVIFLSERVRKERVSIDDYVKLERCRIHHIEDDSIPKIFFAIMIRNNSLFDVTLKDKIGGHISFRGEVLQEAKRFHGSPEEISSASFEWLFIEYRLSKSEFDLINDRKRGKNDFNITNLVLNIKGTKENQKVESRQMKIDPIQVEGWDSRGEVKEDIATKPQPNIVWAETYHTNLSFSSHFEQYEYGEYKGVLVAFCNELIPDKEISAFGDVRARIFYTDLQGGKKPLGVANGFWLGEVDSVRFNKGDTETLVLCLLNEGKASFPERDKKIGDFKINENFSEKGFDIEVQLIGENQPPKIFKFKLESSEKGWELDFVDETNPSTKS